MQILFLFIFNHKQKRVHNNCTKFIFKGFLKHLFICSHSSLNICMFEKMTERVTAGNTIRTDKCSLHKVLEIFT